LIKAADLFSKQTEDRDLHVVEAFDEIVHLLLPPHPHAVNAFQELEDPGGLFHKQRRDEKQRIFEKSKAPFDTRLAFILDPQVFSG
jgi:hypothetical protein